MKKKISISIEMSLLDKIEKQMRVLQQYDRSKFINHMIRQALFNSMEHYKFLEKLKNDALTRFRIINDEFISFAEEIEAQQKAKEEIIAEPMPQTLERCH